MKRKILYLFLLVLFSFSGRVFADNLYLKNGTKFAGSIVRQDDEKILFSIGDAEDWVEATFYNEEILRIDKAEVSSFISLPFGEGKNVEIPRPLFKQQPVVSEQVKTQKEQIAKSNKSAEEVPELEIIKPGYVEPEAEQPEQAENPEETSEETKTWQEEAQPEDAPSPEQVTTPQTKPEATPPKVIRDSGASLESARMTKELSELLDDKERSYFLRLNSLVQKVTSRMSGLLANPAAFTQKSESLLQLIQGMPAEIDGIITKLEALEVPELFVDFHNRYLDNLNMMKEVFNDMSKGDITSSQSKIQSLQETSVELQEELSKILAKKKAQT